MNWTFKTWGVIVQDSKIDIVKVQHDYTASYTAGFRPVFTNTLKQHYHFFIPHLESKYYPID